MHKHLQRREMCGHFDRQSCLVIVKPRFLADVGSSNVCAEPCFQVDATEVLQGNSVGLGVREF